MDSGITPTSKSLESATDHGPSLDTAAQPPSNGAEATLAHPASSSSPATAKNPTSKDSKTEEVVGEQQKRNGSITSSKRVSRAEPQPSSTTGPSAATGSISKIPQKKRGGVSRIFSFLNCCGGPSAAGDIDLDEHAVPVQTNKTLSAQQSSAKKDTSAPESSTGESKDLAMEKIGGPPYSDLKSAGEPKIQDQPRSGGVVQSAPQPSSEKQLEGGKLGDAVVALKPSLTSTGSDQKGSVASSGDAAVPPDGEKIINDRTPQQEAIDTEIEMAEAPQLDQATIDESGGAEETKADPSPPLPPPPPITPRRHDSSSRQPDRSTQTNGPSEQQKWLLPPIRQEHKGRKCLVLDLDETLVHSSFKVSLITSGISSH